MMWTVSAITSVHDAQIVTLEREDQTLSGRWSTKAIPLLGTMTYAEIDIDVVMDDIDREEVVETKSRSALSGLNNIIIGLVESVDDDLMHFFRISDDCLVMIQSNTTKLCVNTFYRLIVPINSLSIHPC
ncbi:hypothetical protein [Deinococcus hohokamensis]|uniref:Uncharacterized protein n=1 Tax=Deinococcus hohokamensis TaxID=309883 RepID=A0ABV9I7E1_9DEIO